MPLPLPPPEPALLSQQQAAHRLSIGLARLKQLIAEGSLEVVDLGPRTRRVTARSVDAFIEQNARTQS